MGSELRPLILDGVNIIPIGDNLYWLGSSTITFAGQRFANNVPIQWKDVGGTVRSTLLIDSSSYLKITPYGNRTTIAGGASSPAPDSALHVWSGSAGSVSAYNTTGITIENSDNDWITFLTPNNKVGGIIWGDQDSNDVAEFKYSHATNKFIWWIGSDKLYMSTSTLEFQAAFTISSTIVNGLIIDNPVITNTAAADVFRFSFASTNAITLNTGTVPVLSSVVIDEPNITIGTGAATIATSLYIKGQPTEGSTNCSIYLGAATSAIRGFGELQLIAATGSALDLRGPAGLYLNSNINEAIYLWGSSYGTGLSMVLFASDPASGIGNNNDSGAILMRGRYRNGSDALTNFDGKVLLNMTAGGATPAAQFDWTINDVALFSLINTNGTPSATFAGIVTHNANILLNDSGSNTNSYALTFEANNGGTIQNGYIDVCYGTEPYMRIAVPTGAGVATAVINIKVDRWALIDEYSICSNTSADDYFTLRGYDIGAASYATVATIATHATQPYMKLDLAKFGVAALTADVDHRGMLYFTEGGAGVADKLYCIMKNSADAYEAVQVAIAS